MNILSKNRTIDVKELEAKIQRVRKKSDNPTARQYADKLSELLDSKATARDNFVNWITGLATGSMFLAFSNASSALPDDNLILLLSGTTSFLCIISALAFKILLEVRFSALELEVSLLKNIWEGHDIRAELAPLMQEGEDIPEEQKQRFLQNLDQSLNYLDENHLKELKRPINIKSKLWVWSYWLTLGLFLAALSLMVLYYV